MTDKEIANFIKKSAEEEGYDLAGITEAKSLDEESDHLREWLNRGYHGTMAWMEKNFENRTDPRKVLNDARSVISLGVNYYDHSVHGEDTAKISRYAWGDDYHVIIGEKLQRYVNRLQKKFPSNKFIPYCDTGPVMDKAWAQRAGIGWIGKHTNVINRGIGSWIFLGEVITDLECEFDPPAIDHCGSCRECINACPTEAIVEPYVLDANKCISFLTIENRDEQIPPNLASKLDSWIFGCDICQDVCPWNKKFQTTTSEPAFGPRDGFLNLKVEDIHLMTREEFGKRFSHSPVKRAKYEGLQRNARAVMDSRLPKNELERKNI